MTDFTDFWPLFERDEDVIRTAINARANAGLTPDQPEYIDVREGSFFYVNTQPLVIFLAEAYDRMNEVAAAAIIDTSWEQYLDYHAESFGQQRKPAVFASGLVTFTGVAGSLIGTDTEVSPPQTDPEVEPPIFRTTASGTIPAAASAPTGLAAVGSNSGGALASATYRYVVTATDDAGETTGSAEASSGAVTGPSGSVALTWNAVPTAVTYKVYRGTAAGGPYALVATVSIPSYADLGGQTPGAAPPVVNTTGGKKTLSIAAQQPGVDGNVAAGTITQLNTAVDGVASVTNAAATSGGTEIESDEDLKTRLKALFSGGGTGTAGWYAREALEEPGVGRVTVVPVWNGAGTVQVIIMTATGHAVAGAIVTSLQNRLDPVAGQGKGEAPVDHTVTVQTPAEIAVNVSATVTFKPGYSLDGATGSVALRTQIDAVLRDYLNGLAAGDDVIYNHVLAQFFRVEGVLNVSNLKTGTAQPPLGTTDIAISTTPAQVAVAGANIGTNLV